MCVSGKLGAHHSFCTSNHARSASGGQLSSPGMYKCSGKHKNPALNGARRSSLFKKKNNWLLLRNKSLPGILRSIFLVEPV